MVDESSRAARPLRTCIAALVVIACAALVDVAALRGASHFAQKDLFDEIHARGRPLESTLRTITASFVETSTSTLLAKPLVARGTLAVERPSRIVLQYREPDVRRLLIDGDLMLVTWPSRNIRRQQDIGASQARVQKYFVGKSPDELRRHFRITARVPPERVTLWHISMVPTRKQLQQGVSRIELWIDQQTNLPASMQLTFPNGDTKLLEFSDVRVNPALPPDTFSREGTTGAPLPLSAPRW